MVTEIQSAKIAHCYKQLQTRAINKCFPSTQSMALQHCEDPGAARLDLGTPASQSWQGVGRRGWHSPGRRLDEGGGVQVVDLVELQQGGQMLELLIADLKAAVGQGVDDVVGNPGVLGHREHVVSRAGGRVPHQEHAVPLPLQPRLRLRPRHRAHVPAGAVRRIETSGGGHGSGRGRGRERGKEGEEPEGPGGGRDPGKRRPGRRNGLWERRKRRAPGPAGRKLRERGMLRKKLRASGDGGPRGGWGGAGQTRRSGPPSLPQRRGVQGILPASLSGLQLAKSGGG